MTPKLSGIVPAVSGHPARSRRLVVVAESPFLPAHGGGEREHLGFVEAAVAAGVVAALVLPSDPDPAAVGREDDLVAIRRLVEPAPVISVPRRRSVRRALSPRYPYVVASRPAPPGLVEQVRRAAPDADAVLVFAYKSHRIGRVLAEGLGLPVVLRCHNLEGRYHRALAAAAAPPRAWAVWLEALRVELDERLLERSSWLAGIADISAADAAVRERRARIPVGYVPSFALGTQQPTTGAARTPSPRPTVLFLGALDVATNHDAIAWFAEHSWPLVRAAVPDCRWQVVGRRPTAQVRALVGRTPGAELCADVPEPASFLAAADVSVNPAVSGSGVNIKLVEYLAAGAPVVSTTRGSAGLGLTPGQDLLVADSPGEFAAAIEDLLTGRRDGAQLGAAGQASARQILDTRASLSRLLAMLE
jgi:glycosyltransferase involved in cell wall biosynthesis